MMKRNVISVIFVLILVGVAFYFFRTNNKSTLRSKDSDFAIEDTSRISAIHITKFGEEVLLKKDNQTWVVNDDFIARPAAVDALLNVLMHLEVKAPVSKSFRDRIVEQLDKQGFELTIYSGNKILKHIQVFQDTLNNATYMMLEGARQPFVMQLPGYSSSIGDLFILNSGYWRDNTICKYNVKDILWLSIDYPFQPEMSFSIENTGDDFILKSLYEDEQITEALRDKLLNYLFEFNHLVFDEFLYENISGEAKASVITEDPHVIITIKDFNNNIQIIKGFPIPVEDTYDELGNEIKYDLDRMYGLLNDKDLVIISYFEMSGVLKKLTDFFNE